MATATSNLSLVIPEATDATVVRTVYNLNWNTIDDIFNTVTLVEFSYLDGVTSAIQTQLNAKQALDAGLTSIAGLTTAVDKMIYTTALDTYAVASLTAFGRTLIDDADASTARTTLGLAIGANIQAYDAGLTAIAALAMTDSNMLVGNGTTWVLESGATLLTSIGAAAIAQTMYIGTTGVAINRTSAALTLAGLTLTTPNLGTPSTLVGTNISGTAASLTAGAVTNATLTTALTVNTGTLTLTANVANNSVLTIGAGAVSVSGANTGDQTLGGLGAAASGANSDITSITGLTTPLGAAYGGTGVANNAASTLTISGNFTTTLTVTEATSVTLPASGTLINSTDTAAVATGFTCTDNESEALNCPIIFVDGATGTRGAETDGDLHYNPSTGTVTATVFAGALTGQASTVATITGLAPDTATTQATQASITTCANLTTIGTVTTGGLGTGAVLADVTMTLGSDADGDVYYRASNKLARLAKGTATQVLAMNAGATAPEWVAGGAGDALTSGKLSQFAATTSAELAGVISDETGTDKLVYNTSPTLVTPLLGTPTSGVVTNLTGAFTGVTSMLNAALYVGRDSQNTIDFGTDNNIIFKTNNVAGALIGVTGELDMNANSIGFTLQTLTGDGTDDIDWKLGNKMQFTCPAGDETFTFTAPTNPCNLLLEIIQDGVGGRDITFPANVKWLGTEPTWSDGGASKTIVMSMWYNGTNYWSQATSWEA